MSDNKHRRVYKYNNLDAEELRKRREDTSIMLRKQKREEQVISAFRCLKKMQAISSKKVNHFFSIL